MKRMARRAALAAEPGPSGWRNVYIADKGRGEGGPAVLRALDWYLDARGGAPKNFSTLDRGYHRTLWIVGPRNLNQVNSCPNPAHANCEPIELAEVLMKLAECVVIEQHIGKLLEVVERTNLGLGAPDAAALAVRVVRGRASDIASTPKADTDGDVIMPIDLENACERAFGSTCLEARLACPPLAATCAAQ